HSGGRQAWGAGCPDAVEWAVAFGIPRGPRDYRAGAEDQRTAVHGGRGPPARGGPSGSGRRVDAAAAGFGARVRLVSLGHRTLAAGGDDATGASRPAAD